MYSINDVVVYALYGVCRIKAVESRDFSGEPKDYYILQPVEASKNTFYVPTDSEALKAKMRRICSRSEIEELIKVMPDEDIISIENEFQRKEAYQKILDGGDRCELVRMIKTLWLHRQKLEEQRKKLHSSDERFLREAENLLYDEFAYVLEIPRDEVVSYIKEHIES